ncbi:MAG: AAA family ATPase, partial [Pseudomonadota bacterium]|nr:AAA family ATPase [Pseudomonadota bacterium]
MMYISYFGFSKPPFTGSDSQTFLRSPAYQAAGDCLRQGIRQRHGLLLLTGAAGTGKTTLLRHLLDSLGDGVHGILLWNAHLHLDDLLSYLGDNLGLSIPAGADRAAVVRLLEEALSQRLAQGQRVIVVLDDAQNLPAETLSGLQLLTALVHDRQPLLQVILSGQLGLEARLAKEPVLWPLARLIDHRCRLNPLDDQQVVRYVRERMQAAGCKNPDLFDEEALRKVIAHSRGVPRLIDLICNQALLLAYLNGERQVSGPLVREVAVDSQLPRRDLDTVPPLRTLAEQAPAGPADDEAGGPA